MTFFLLFALYFRIHVLCSTGLGPAVAALHYSFGLHQGRKHFYNEAALL